jgi:hypothetical protein
MMKACGVAVEREEQVDRLRYRRDKVINENNINLELVKK